MTTERDHHIDLTWDAEHVRAEQAAERGRALGAAWLGGFR